MLPLIDTASQPFTTYQRRHSVINYILVDPNLIRSIQAIGYKPFNLHIMSDHRGIFMDLVTSQCFGTAITPLLPREIRDLSTKRSHQIAPYFETKHEYLTNHRWFDKLAVLRKHMQDETPNHALAETLYTQLIKASNLGGSRLRSYPPAPYSPTIAKLRNLQRLLKLVVVEMKTSQDMSESIARTKAKLGNAGIAVPKTLTLCQQALARATRQLKAALQDELDTQNLRQQHQERLIETHKAKGNSKLAKKIRGMQRAEETKWVFQKCQKAQHIQVKGGLSYILVPVNPQDNPKTCTEWRRVDCPKEMSTILQARNRAHFGQSKDCTWTTPPMDYTSDFSATCP